MKILVIEDDPYILKNIDDILRLEGYDTLVAANGREGVAVATANLPALIICDIMMPELTGYEVLEALRANPTTASIPFIFLTARADRTDQRRGMELGADDYISKPFRSDEILAAVKARLEKHGELVHKYDAAIVQLRQNIIYALPHELRTPLSVIIGTAELLHADPGGFDTGLIAEMGSAILTSGYRLQHLIESYLVYAQLELVAADPDRIARMRSSRVAGVCEIIADEAARRAEKRGRSGDLQLSLEAGELPMTEADLRKIVYELVDNAFKFSAGGSKVTVQSSASAGHYGIAISDGGRGMTADEVASIGAFMQFGRAVYEQQGMGLGLTISRRLVELYGGTFTIHSLPNRGTRVEVVLPLA